MNLYEMKKKVLGLIEEVNPDAEALTDDPDIATKFNDVTNQVMFEMVRMKKIPKFVEMEVKEGDTIEFADIEAKCGYEIYQLALVAGVECKYKADGTVIKVMEDGTMEIDCYVYPERITEKTKDKAYEFELAPDALEVMVYGVAAHLLLSDVSADYGKHYLEVYERMLQRLDPRYHTTGIYIEGGVL